MLERDGIAIHCPCSDPAPLPFSASKDMQVEEVPAAGGTTAVRRLLSVAVPLLPTQLVGTWLLVTNSFFTLGRAKKDKILLAAQKVTAKCP